jgi:hypothetical protein
MNRIPPPPSHITNGPTATNTEAMVSPKLNTKKYADVVVGQIMGKLASFNTEDMHTFVNQNAQIFRSKLDRADPIDSNYQKIVVTSAVFDTFEVLRSGHLSQITNPSHEKASITDEQQAVLDEIKIICNKSQADTVTSTDIQSHYNELHTKYIKDKNYNMLVPLSSFEGRSDSEIELLQSGEMKLSTLLFFLQQELTQGNGQNGERAAIIDAAKKAYNRLKELDIVS